MIRRARVTEGHPHSADEWIAPIEAAAILYGGPACGGRAAPSADPKMIHSSPCGALTGTAFRPTVILLLLRVGVAAWWQASAFLVGTSTAGP